MTTYPQVWISKPVAAKIGAVELAQRPFGRGHQSKVEVTPEVYERLTNMMSAKAFGASLGRQSEKALARFEAAKFADAAVDQAA
jgi:hypothetical protein